MIKPIPKFQNYFFTPAQKKVYGITAEGIAELDIINQDGEPVNLIDFFSKNEELYFFIEEKKQIFYKQDKSGKVSELTTKPVRPELHRSALENSEFSIKNFDYKGTPCSDVNNEGIKDIGPERFLLVNGFCYFPGAGLFFNIAEGRPTVRREGLAFWNVDSKVYNYIKVPIGEIW